MAKNFIALEETSQAIKTTVEDIQTDVESVGTAVNEIKEDVGDGAGTDLVTRVANLEAKIDALASSGGDSDVYVISGSTYTITGTDIIQAASQSGGTKHALAFISDVMGYAHLTCKLSSAKTVTSTLQIYINGVLYFDRSCGSESSVDIDLTIPIIKGALYDFYLHYIKTSTTSNTLNSTLSNLKIAYDLTTNSIVTNGFVKL